MDGPNPPPGAVLAPREARQRWRLTFARSADAPARAQREQVDAWEAGLMASGLPIAGLDLPRPRPRIVFAAPLPTGMPAERELVDLYLVERAAIADVRAALDRALPEGHVLIDLHDVWLGEPALSGQVAAADYRVDVVVGSEAGPSTDATHDSPGTRATLDRAARVLIERPTLPRTRDKGGRQVAYDLRPLVISVVIDADTGRGGHLRLLIRTRFDAERGVGRPEEVVAALAEIADLPLEVESIVRARVLLAAELGQPTGRPAT
jgi:radical SAM-linked protein